VTPIPAALQDAYFVNSKGVIEEYEQESDYETPIWWQQQALSVPSKPQLPGGLDDMDGSNSRAGKQPRIDSDHADVEEIPLFDQEVFKNADSALAAVDADVTMEEGEESDSDIAATEAAGEPVSADDDFEDEAGTGPERESDGDSDGDIMDGDLEEQESPEYSDYEAGEGSLSDRSGDDETYGYSDEPVTAFVSQDASSARASPSSSANSMTVTADSYINYYHIDTIYGQGFSVS
jgi:hypothetical protein